MIFGNCNNDKVPFLVFVLSQEFIFFLRKILWRYSDMELGGFGEFIKWVEKICDIIEITVADKIKICVWYFGGANFFE